MPFSVFSPKSAPIYSFSLISIEKILELGKFIPNYCFLLRFVIIDRKFKEPYEKDPSICFTYYDSEHERAIILFFLFDLSYVLDYPFS